MLSWVRKTSLKLASWEVTSSPHFVGGDVWMKPGDIYRPLIPESLQVLAATPRWNTVLQAIIGAGGALVAQLHGTFQAGRRVPPVLISTGHALTLPSWLSLMCG